MENNKLKSSTAILIALIVVIVGIILIVKNKKTDEVLTPGEASTSSESVLGSIFKKKKTPVEPLPEEGPIKADEAVWEEETPFYTTTRIPESTMSVRSDYVISLEDEHDGIYTFVGPSNYLESVKYFSEPDSHPTVGGVLLSYSGSETFGDREYKIYKKLTGDAMTYYYIENENVGLLFSTETTDGLVSVDLSTVTLK